VNRLAISLLVATLGSCTFLKMSDRPARVSDLVGWVELVHVESELAQKKMREAVSSLSDLAASNYEGPPVEAYKRFVTALEESQAQAEKLRGAIGPMKASGQPVFDQWTKDLEQFSSASMRDRSQKRMARTQDQFRVVVAAADPAQTTFDAFNRTLRDHALFLGHDFNPSSVQMIQDDVRQLATLAKELDGRLVYCLKAAQEYVNSYALPVGVTDNPGPAGEGKSDQTSRR
jgi:Protein of unknown function (DUF2959)